MRKGYQREGKRILVETFTSRTRIWSNDTGLFRRKDENERERFPRREEWGGIRRMELTAGLLLRVVVRSVPVGNLLSRGVVQLVECGVLGWITC
jgi:hypothetical protein